MLMKGSTPVSVSQPFAVLWAFLTSLGASKKLTLYAEWKTWHGLQPYPVPAILLRCAFGHKENQVGGMAGCKWSLWWSPQT